MAEFAGEGVDLSDPQVESSALVAAGKTFCGRYISGESSAKILTLAEAISRSRAGLDLFSNYETTGVDFEQGHVAGVTAGTQALAGARLVHQPPGTPIYFSADTDIDKDINPGQLGELQAYLQGCASVISPTYPVGIYGSTDALTAMAEAGAAQFFWQSESTGYSGGRNAAQNPHDNLWQYLGGTTVPDTDNDHAVTAWFGQWRAPLVSTDLYLTWAGADQESVWWSTYNGHSWSGQQQISGLSTATTPALALYQGYPHLAWKGSFEDTDLWWSTFDGHSWTAQQSLPVSGSSVRPALTLFQNQLYLVFRGVGNDVSMRWTAYNGHSWSSEQKIPGASSNPGPGVAVFDGRLYVTWVGETNPGIYYSSFDGKTWSHPQQVPGVGASDGPALAVFDNKLYLAWQGERDGTGIWWTTFDGSSWSAQQRVPAAETSLGPTLAVFDDLLYMSWLGPAESVQSDVLFWSYFDGKSWSAQQQVPGATASSAAGLLAP